MSSISPTKILAIADKNCGRRKVYSMVKKGEDHCDVGCLLKRYHTLNDAGIWCALPWWTGFILGEYGNVSFLIRCHCGYYDCIVCLYPSSSERVLCASISIVQPDCKTNVTMAIATTTATAPSLGIGWIRVCIWPHVWPANGVCDLLIAPMIWCLLHYNI